MSTGLLLHQMSRILADMLVLAFELDGIRRQMMNVKLSPGDRMIWAGKEAQLLQLLKKMEQFLRQLEMKMYQMTHTQQRPPPPPAAATGHEE